MAGWATLWPRVQNLEVEIEIEVVMSLECWNMMADDVRPHLSFLEGLVGCDSPAD